MAIHTLSTLLPTLQVELRLPLIAIAHGHGGHPTIRTALVDTGSSITAISPAVRGALNPSHFGKVLYHPRGQNPIWTDTYLVIVEIEPHTNPGRTFTLEVIEEQPVSTCLAGRWGRIMRQLVFQTVTKFNHFR
jgi:hypothetical protein